MNGTIIDRSSMPVICARVLTCSADEIWFLSKVLYSYVLAFRTLLFDICFCPFLSVPVSLAKERHFEDDQNRFNSVHYVKSSGPPYVPTSTDNFGPQRRHTTIN